MCMCPNHRLIGKTTPDIYVKGSACAQVILSSVFNPWLSGFIFPPALNLA